MKVGDFVRVSPNEIGVVLFVQHPQYTAEGVAQPYAEGTDVQADVKILDRFGSVKVLRVSVTSLVSLDSAPKETSKVFGA